MKIKTKICNECKIEKSFDEFYKNKTGRFGILAVCKICNNKHSSKYQKDNQDKHREYCKQWQRNNPLPGRKRAAKWAKENPEKVQKNKNKWKLKNKEKIKKYYRKRQEEKRKNPVYRLNSSISDRIRKSFKNGKLGRSWESLVGYTLEDLKHHLEKQFTNGMTWETYGNKGWTIDHKIPLSVHCFNKPEHEDFKKAWSLKNLQPMWAKENMSKGAKLTKHFQPSLLL